MGSHGLARVVCAGRDRAAASLHRAVSRQKIQLEATWTDKEGRYKRANSMIKCMIISSLHTVTVLSLSFFLLAFCSETLVGRGRLASSWPVRPLPRSLRPTAAAAVAMSAKGEEKTHAKKKPKGKPVEFDRVRRRNSSRRQQPAEPKERRAIRWVGTGGGPALTCRPCRPSACTVLAQVRPPSAAALLLQCRARSLVSPWEAACSAPHLACRPGAHG